MHLTHTKLCDKVITTHTKLCETRKGGIKVKANRRKLEIAMAAKCMNTMDLQKFSGLPRPTLNNVIGGRNVRPATLGVVAKALKVDVTEILEDETKKE